MQKQKTITLGYRSLDGRFVVQRVTESIEYVPGRELDSKAVDALCADRKWKVTVVQHGNAS